MRATAEVRWFYAGAVPAPVHSWFHALDGPVEEEEARTDLYLHPTDEALNVKARAGRLEIKRRDAVGAPVRITPQVAGCLEGWRKWSFALEEDPPGAAGPLWMPVRKRRCTRSYRVGQSGIEVLSGAAEPARGCDLELSRLEADGRAWWSLCFEAYGEAAALRDTLLQTARQVFAEAAPPALRLDHSFGYAAWLLKQ